MRLVKGRIWPRGCSLSRWEIPVLIPLRPRCPRHIVPFHPPDTKHHNTFHLMWYEAVNAHARTFAFIAWKSTQMKTVGIAASKVIQSGQIARAMNWPMDRKNHPRLSVGAVLVKRFLYYRWIIYQNKWCSCIIIICSSVSLKLFYIYHLSNKLETQFKVHYKWVKKNGIFRKQEWNYRPMHSNCNRMKS